MSKSNDNLIDEMEYNERERNELLDASYEDKSYIIVTVETPTGQNNMRRIGVTDGLINENTLQEMVDTLYNTNF